jgi:hypothetical protein
VEYYCRFKTNRFGLVDTNYDSHYAAVDYLILGDSFLEGQGGCPWLTRASLPERFPIIINGGLPGASIRTMELLENWLAARVDIRNIALVLISNDFKRVPVRGIWRSRQECLVEGRCEAGLDYVWGIAPDVTEQKLTRISRQVFEQRDEGFWHQVMATLAYHSFAISIFERYATVFRKTEAAFTSETQEAFSINFLALRRLRSKYPELRIVLVPQRDEVGFLDRENEDTGRVRQFLSDEHISYYLCQLGLADYMPTDGHPNRAGYQKLRACVGRALQ